MPLMFSLISCSKQTGDEIHSQPQNLSLKIPAKNDSLQGSSNTTTEHQVSANTDDIGQYRHPILPQYSDANSRNTGFLQQQETATMQRQPRCIFTVRLHVMQRMVLLSEFCPSVHPSVRQMRVL